MRYYPSISGKQLDNFDGDVKEFNFKLQPFHPSNFYIWSDLPVRTFDWIGGVNDLLKLMNLSKQVPISSRNYRREEA